MVFLDGYNILNSWPNLEEILKSSLESAREKLIDLMENYAHYKQEKIFIVFDAHKLKSNSRSLEIRSEYVQVIFTKEGETADNYIERRVDELGREFEMIVVTSDMLEQQIIFQRGAIRKSSIEFYEEVKGVMSSIGKDLSIIKQKTSRNHLEDKLDKNVINFLEKMRKSEN